MQSLEGTDWSLEEREVFLVAQFRSYGRESENLGFTRLAIGSFSWDYCPSTDGWGKCVSYGFPFPPWQSPQLSYLVG